ncbi:EAL domain-containing protein [Psychromonas sp.]|uniref:EAL domain-containing protein n=1 Tax=Psychromonas sp. TaxID=1884585 RepID=UPI0035658418
MPNLTDLSLEKIIQGKKLSVYFQPIIENNAPVIFGYEALIRGPINTAFYSPLSLFKAASEQGRLVALELLCRELSIVQFKKLNLPGKLFLNASPETLFQPNFRSGRTLAMLQKIGLDPRRVVIELTEHSPLENYEVVREALKHYKTMGFEIAMDDLGAGYSGLRMWYELRPDYVKIDRHFIHNIHNDKVKQQFVHSIKNIAKELNCKVIAEGVETAAEFKFIEKMNLPLYQGYYIAHPALLPARRIKNDIFSATRLTKKSSNKLISSETVGALLQHVDVINLATTVESSASLFNKNPQLESIPVIDGKKAVGLLRRNSLTKLFFSQYGRELSGKNSIGSLVDRHVLFLESDLPIEQASGLISEQVEKQKALEFIITRNGQYQGIGSIIDLLKIITDLQINNARYANPLTLLPGNVPINKKLDQHLQQQSVFTVCYLDLDNFKPYNDYYGYEKGDQIITGLADILRETVTNRDDFIGHIGGDDFILILSTDNWQQQCDSILEKFSEWVRHRYRPEDQMMGGISGVDRAGEKQFYPLLSLSIGSVCLPPPVCKCSQEIAVLASHAKSMAKKTRGNSLFIYDSREINDYSQKQRLNTGVC